MVDDAMISRSGWLDELRAQKWISSYASGIGSGALSSNA